MTSASLQPELGERLRAVRRGRGLALTEVGAATGISASFLSLVESGKNDLTISRLARLCRFYGVSVSDLLPELGPSDAIVLRRGEHRHFSSPAEGIHIFLLAPDTNRLMMPVSMSFEPGGGFAEVSSHPGETFVTVVEGRLEVQIEGEPRPAVLEEGDTAYFRSGLQVSYRNCGEGCARMLAVVSPPKP